MIRPTDISVSDVRRDGVVGFCVARVRVDGGASGMGFDERFSGSEGVLTRAGDECGFGDAGAGLLGLFCRVGGRA